MNDKSRKLVEDSFKSYYFDHFDLVRVLDRAPEREFGYQKFNSGMTRHLSFKNDGELRVMLMQNVPSDVYCSNACYSFPALEMREKDWREAELIFDIDAKDLGLGCRAGHTVSLCGSCSGASKDPARCDRCGSQKLSKRSLPCKDCIGASKKQVGMLLEILTGDLGIEEGKIRVYFSGNEGFHVHVHDSQFQKLESRERSELADYIMFNGAIPKTFGMGSSGKQNRSSFPEIGEGGWRGRFAREVFGSKSARSKGITELISEGHRAFEERLEGLSQAMGVRIDPGVTMDVHRIFRLPGSINSKSGMAKVPCPDLDPFDPYREAVLLGDGPVEVEASCPVGFRLKGRKFGPYAGERVAVPGYAAVYLICKGLAEAA